MDDMEDSDFATSIVPFQEISIEQFPAILEFLYLFNEEAAYKDPPTPLESGNLADYFPSSLVEFIEAHSLEEVYELLCDANFWDIKPLTQLAAARFARDMRGKSLGVLREMFGIQANFTDRQKEQILLENEASEKLKLNI